jgi:hypothetical protein
MLPVYLLKADAADRRDCYKKSQEGLCGKVLAAANWASG